MKTKNKFLWMLAGMLITFLSATAQQKSPQDRSIASQVVADKALWTREFFNAPHGATPGFPAYVPDSLKKGAFFNATGTNTSYPKGLYRYNGTDWELQSISGGAQHYVDSLVKNLNPSGQRNYQQYVNTSGFNSYFTDPQIKFGQFVTNDTQLSTALTRGSSTQLQIFNTFGRYSHGTTPVLPTGGIASNNIPGNPSHTNSWAYDSVAKAVNSTFNTGDHIGFFSPDKFLNYSHTVTLSSIHADNDWIGVDIAFMRDPAHLVTNYAYGLDPATFGWPINTTSPLIPDEHVITLLRSRNDNANCYYVVYDFMKLTQKIIAQGSTMGGLYKTLSNWSGASVDVQVIRSGDTITVKTSQFSDAPGGKGALGFAMTFNLGSDPDLYKFRGPQSYGYSARSQAEAKFDGIVFTATNNAVYDLRNGDAYTFGSIGYVLNLTRNFYGDIGPDRLVFDQYTHKSYYMSPDSVVHQIADGNTPDSSLIALKNGNADMAQKSYKGNGIRLKYSGTAGVPPSGYAEISIDAVGSETITKANGNKRVFKFPHSGDETAYFPDASVTHLADRDSVAAGYLPKNNPVYTGKAVGPGSIVGDSTRNSLIYAFGTSITKGVGSANITQYDSTYLAKLGKAMGFRWTNRGLTSRFLEYTTVGDSSGYQQRYNIPSPTSINDIYLIELRVNDAFHDSTFYNPANYRIQLDSMVMAAHSKGWAFNKIWIHNSGYYNPVSGNPTAPNTEYRNALFAAQDQAEATARGTLYSDNYAAMKTAWLSDATLYDSNVLHPTSKGHTKIAQLDSIYLTSVGITRINLANNIKTVVGSEYIYGNSNIQQNVNARNNVSAGNNVSALFDIFAGRNSYINTTPVALGVQSTDPFLGWNSTTKQVSKKTLYATDAYQLWGARSTSGTLDFNDATNMVNGFAPTLLRGSTASNPPNTTTAFWHAFNIEMGLTKDETGNITQLAFPYTDATAQPQGIFYRGRNSGTWGGWYQTVSAPVVSVANGQIPIRAGNGFTFAPITGTTNQITITNASGSITISLPSTLVLPNGTTATTQAAGDNTTKIQTTAGTIQERTAAAPVANKTFLPANVHQTPTGATTDSIATKNAATGKLGAVKRLSPTQLDTTQVTGLSLKYLPRSYIASDLTSLSANMVPSVAAVTANPILLSKFPNADMKVSSVFAAYTVPAGKSFVVTRIIIVCNAATAITVPPSIQFYKTTPGDMNIPTTTLTNLTTVGATYSITPSADSIIITAGNTFKFNVSTQATGTSETADIYVIGMLI